MLGNWVGSIRPPPPVYEEAVSARFPHPTLKRDDVSGIEFLLFHKPAPPFCHHVALTAVPVGVSEPPWLPASVLEIEQKSFFVRGGIEREVLLGVLLRDDKPIQLPDIARGYYLIEHVLSLHAFDSAFVVVVVVTVVCY